MARKTDRCSTCTKNDNNIKCKDSRAEWHSGKHCNNYVKIYTERVRIVKHPRLDLVTFFSDMER
jgi:hypothetical protein